MKRLYFLVMVVAFFTISSSITDAQLNVKKIKNKAKSAVSKEETKEQDPAQKQDVMFETDAASQQPH